MHNNDTVKGHGELIHAREALLPEGWADDVLVQVDSAGRISTVESGVAAPAGATQKGLLIPAPVNLHSHAFQRAMAGLTERRGPETTPGQPDSFWTWRHLMFRFLDQLNPDHIEAIAAFVQMEMAEAGYGASVEFHYLHHLPGGARYDDLAELSARIAAAAQQSQIGLTLLPVLYQTGGCDGRPLGPGQIRFGNDPEQFARLTEGAGKSLAALPADAMLGIAPHSLRAVTPEGLQAAIELHAGLPANAPIHMHLAEQIPEVAEVLQHLKARPVEYLLENAAINDRWCLIHCTQMLPDETKALARTGAVAGLCPMTESSLGDGIFDGVNYLGHRGRIGIGSDSNIRISLSEELRTLEYSQRLRDNGRAMLADAGRSTARRMLEEICAGGAQAAGRSSGAIKAGNWADLTALDMDSVHMTGRAGDTALDSFVFAGDDRLVSDVWSAGRHIVVAGRHIARDTIIAGYRKTLHALKDLM